MKALWISLLLALASLSAISVQEDLQGKAFIFPQEGDSYVTLKSAQANTLQMFTICLRSLTNLLKHNIYFSYATKDQDRDIVIYQPYTYQGESPHYVICIGGEEASFRIVSSFLNWQNICVTWDSATGVITVWVNGFNLARRVVQKGYSIGADALITLGKVYYSGSPRGVRGEAFSGEIKDVYMWNTTIPMKDLIKTSWDSLFPSPVISWRNLQYEITGNVTLG